MVIDRPTPNIINARTRVKSISVYPFINSFQDNNKYVLV